MRIYPVKRLLGAMILAFIAGLWLGNAASLSWEGCVFLLPIFLGVVLYAVCSHRGRLLLLCLPVLVLGFVLMHAENAQQRALADLHGEEVRVLATITRAPADKTFVDADVQQIGDTVLESPIHLRIQRPWEDATAYTPRAVYAFAGELRAPEPQTNPGGYDEAKILAQRGIFSVLEAEEIGEHVAEPPAWAAEVQQLKAACLAQFDAHLDAGEAALLSATLFGDVSALDDDFYTASQQFGIIHIFSVSGLHVSFIFAFLLAAARLLRLQNSALLIVFVAPLLALYTLLSDASAPAVRAALMGVLALLALRLLRYRDPLTIIALAALALLVSDPYNLWQIGFQLSFLVMLGITLLTPRIRPYLNRLPSLVAESVAVSLATELVSLPLVAYYFYMVAPLTTLMNLLVVPFFSLLVPFALIALLLAWPLPALGGVFFLPIKVLITAIIALMNLVHGLTGTLHFYIGQPPLALMLLYYAALLLFVCVPFKRRALCHGALALTLAVAMLVILLPGADRDLRLTMVDVGQGTGCAYQSAAGDWLVFDTGPGADTMAQYLRYCGVNEIAAIVLSHSDDDHIGGAAHLLRDFRVQQILASPYAQTTDEWQTLSPYLGETDVVTIDAPAQFALGDARLELLLLDADNRGSDNANQIVARLAESGDSVVFTGDADTRALADIPWQQATVVVVPHHGSKNSWSDAFYDQLAPDLALISAGRDNRYGHPHPIVTDGLADHHIPAAVTADSGAIRLYADDGNLLMNTFLQ
ncbi:MAG: DNA internalization-related competence protein ComEC/Rec2 [Peptococcaceae bacterium]|nr:DNA internalization-related competence protein ComEC/Rec2 [Peptococcaceae bacterium]